MKSDEPRTRGPFDSAHMQAHTLLFAAWIATEVVLLVRKRSSGSSGRDHGSLRWLWVAMVLGCAGGVSLSFLPGWSLPGSARAWYLAGVSAMGAGLALRWWSVLVLGRFFTVDVAIHAGHELVTRGPYRWVRHPSYSGLLLVLLGLCGVLDSELALFCILGPTLPVLLWRIAIEERALAQAFGATWTDYARRTKRLIPLVH